MPEEARAGEIEEARARLEREGSPAATERAKRRRRGDG